jgi:branched-chain amino acid transport system permease protein
VSVLVGRLAVVTIRRQRLLSTAMIMGVMLALPWIDRNAYHLHVVILFVLWLALGEAWNILGGFAGQVSFGHAAFFGVSAYATSLLFVRAHIPLVIGALTGAVAAATIALPIGLMCFRLRGAYFALTMLGIAEIFRLVAINWRSFTGGPVGILFPPIFGNKVPFYYSVMALGVAVLVTAWWILQSRLGFQLRAVREDEEAASAMGISPTFVKIQALGISALFTGLLGGFFAPYQGYVDPDIVFSFADISIGMVVVAVLGGIGTIWGPLIGALVVTILSEVLRSTLGGAHLLVYAALLVAIVRYLPEGVLGLLLRGSRQSAFQQSAPEGELETVGATTAVPGARDAVAPSNLVAVGVGDPRRALLEVCGITKTFGGLAALREITMEVKPGEVVGLIGPNGAGKTTLLAVISGFYRPDEGRVVFNGHDITGLPPYRIARLGLARTFQLVRPLSRMTVWENVASAALMRGYALPEARQRALRILEEVGLYHRRHLLAGGLSLGERKFLEVAKALATEPSLILLDEVAAGLTPAERQLLIQMLRRIRSAGVTLVVVEHVMQVVMSVADRLVVLHYGKVIAEGTSEVIGRNPQVIEAYLGQPGVDGDVYAADPA